VRVPPADPEPIPPDAREDVVRGLRPDE
jgi:hypothetical protein